MPDVREYQFVVDQAEQAARAGDFARAEERLREAIGLQEASLGVDHPSLASTLNNLAVVSETLGRFDDAERFYRRAYAIASVALPPSDPLVATSRDNLKDFCAARDLTVEDWPGLDQADVGPAPVPRPTPAPSATPVPPAPRPPATAPAVAAPPRPRWAFGAVAAVALGAIVTAVFWRGAAPAPPSPAGASVAAPAGEPVPPAHVDTPAETAPPAMPPVTAAKVPDAAPARPTAASASAAPATAARLDDVRLVVADVCASLTTSGAWRCERLGAAPAPGRASFYTRIASPRPLRVEHRWYQGAALRQRVTLSVGASPSAGYRTFSRQTLTAGAWRVELRAADGTVLHEAAFDVR